ncbi:MAG: DNA polymerase Y family protein [Gammaproteobacteria bacterium]|nr:DNA polymerase Y family protein [Gammaproteobacteria bacterium]NNF62572.1 DNA polymerase Y family protein [Gammaproteobacteria bacterium]NNM20725.1 DNA polymerase Y family protein [Gammaproteobacteria bacterium]
MAAPGTTFGLFAALPATKKNSPPAALNTPQFPHLWLAIHLPCLALEVLPADTGPVVVVDGEGSRSIVHAASTAARQWGIQPGLGLNAAYALCPELNARSRDLRREKARLEKLAGWAARFTPWVNINPPADLLLEVRGSLRLFGGAEKLCARVGAEIGHEARLAITPTPLAAQWFAQLEQQVILTGPQALAGQLGKLPLRCLQWPEKTRRALRGMGIYTVRDCLRLPRDGFARRFGRRYLAELDRALGRLPDPRPSYSAPPAFTGTVEMPAETSDTGQVFIAAQKLLDQLGNYLVARQAGVQKIAFELLHADQPATRVQVGLLEYSQDARRMLTLVQLKLDELALTAPVIAVTLASGSITTLACRERSLFAQAGNTTDRSDLLENLRTRLGVTAIYRVSGVADYRPELSWRREEPVGPDAASVSDHEPAAERPLWLLPQPQRLQTTGGRPEYDGMLLRESGPERIETGWWDGDDVTRDYYIARDTRGWRLWIYRERRAPHDWYLHGYFG